MKHILCAVYDRKLGAYVQVFQAQTPGQSARSFTDELNRPDSEIGKHPSDYELWQLATVQLDTGEILPEKQLIIAGANATTKG